MDKKAFEIWECDDFRYVRLDGRDNLNPSDHEIWLHKCFPDNIEIFADIGAHAGSHTLRLANRCTTIYAFEPNPVNRRFLEWNLALNSIKNVVIFPVAVGSKTGMGSMNDAGGPSRLGTDGKFVVPIASLDSISIDWKKLDFVKIDVEGFEVEVLRGARETFARLKPGLLIESHHLYGNNLKLLDDLEKELKAIGYSWTVFAHPSYEFSYYLVCTHD